MDLVLIAVQSLNYRAVPGQIRSMTQPHENCPECSVKTYPPQILCTSIIIIIIYFQKSHLKSKQKKTRFFFFFRKRISFVARVVVSMLLWLVGRIWLGKRSGQVQHHRVCELVPSVVLSSCKEHDLLCHYQLC